MGKKELPKRPFYGRNGELERILEDLHWEIATEEALRRQKESRYARPESNDEKYKLERRYKTG